MKLIKIFKCAILCQFILTFSSCGYSNKDIIKMVEERDSLRQSLIDHQNQLLEVDNMIQAINNVMDSIDIEERKVVINFDSESRNGRVRTLKSLDRYAEVLRTQQERINELSEYAMSSQKDSTSSARFQTLVAHLQKEIHKKDSTIRLLRKEITDNKRVIRNQINTIKEQEVQIADLHEENKTQEKALGTQDQMMNQGYVMIAEKKVLKSRHIIRFGKLIADNLLDKKDFKEVDIREFTEITFEAKKPKILSNMPSTSYTLTKSGKTYTLKITDPNAFWAISRYLIIQTNQPLF